MSRADWGADESLRYQDSDTWKGYYANKAGNTTPPTQAQKDYAARVSRIRDYLSTNFPAQNTIVATTDTESGHLLVWPQEHTKDVEKIVIHHTAENNLSDYDDPTLLRAIYYYHTVSRGWGDIGYNYIVGQRGTVYQ